MFKSTGFRLSRLGGRMAGAVSLVALLLWVTSATVSAGDLSKYRDFEFGTSLAKVAKQAEESPLNVREIHSRPALIQELRWRPIAHRDSPDSEPVRQVIFHFYNDDLYQIAVTYDRYETAGLTVGDMVEAISASYGVSVKPQTQAEGAERSYGDPGVVVARWQDAEHSFQLSRSDFGPTYTLVGALTQLDALAQAAIIEAMRLDVKEAPQREIERVEREAEAARSKNAENRLENKPNFRP